MISSRDNPKVKWMRSLLDGRGRKQENSFLVEGAIARRRSAQRRHRAAPGALRSRVAAGKPARAASARTGGQRARRGSEPGGLAVGVRHRYAARRGRGAAHSGDACRRCRRAVWSSSWTHCVTPATSALSCARRKRRPARPSSQRQNSVDLYSPKVARAAMGAHLRLPLLPDLAWPHLTRLLAGRAVYLAEAGVGTPYYAGGLDASRRRWLSATRRRVSGPRRSAAPAAASLFLCPVAPNR